MNNEREQFASRLGFILMTAGCAIGLGNVWRFPYVAGQYGGGLFVLLYWFFLVFLGFPVMMMELALGRAGRSTYPGAFQKLTLSKAKKPWYIIALILFSGSFILLSFYTVITGWLFSYTFEYLKGGANLKSGYFEAFLKSPGNQIICTFVMLAATVAICLGGIRKTIEKSIKWMMGGLFFLLLVLVVKSLCLPNASAGVRFFLMPSFEKFAGNNFLETVHAAMSQAFFTLSLGIGSIAICGSYFGKERSLPNEGLWIVIFDTLVAVCAGLIIFPSCYAYNVAPGAGPSLIFITLPLVFQNMAAGWLWGSLFFLFLTIAAFSTLVAVFENLAAFGIDELKWSRRKSCTVFGLALAVSSLPCVFGFNILSNFHPLGGSSNILDLEDFIVSDNLLPLGALILSIFCTRRFGWSLDNFYNEINTGKGLKFPRFFGFYLKWILPVVIFSIWLIGICKRFF
ncbi:MAG: sodium-dependent transporter [Lentisphaeria bacterium]|nr:sodium-dependent transporter [Lentisphaeria bacterium]